MDETRWEKFSAGAGFAALACGAGAIALERPWPGTTSPAELAAFIADNRAAILGQSMLFLISAGFFMWFLGSLRSFLIQREKGTGRLSTLGFAAGMVAYGLDIAARPRRSP